MKMKKYLMTGIAALALCAGFTSCSHDLEQLSPEEISQLEAKKIVDNYNKAFKAYVGGEISPNQTWGFGVASTRTRAVYADGNHWAAYDEPGCSWKVPPVLTEKQINVVRTYFQTVKGNEYQDPEWTDYFIQQVYKGGDNPGPNSTEKYKAADNQTDIVGSDHMDHLAAVNGTFVDHNNNFNHGDCGVYKNVLKYEEGKPHSKNDTQYQYEDKINLMTGSTTASFGYYNSNCSLRHTEYTRLVSWSTIHTWALTNYPGYDGCLNDGWNRSYMGFDFEMLVDNDVYAIKYYDEYGNETSDKNNAARSEIQYFSVELPNGNEEVWNGTKLVAANTVGEVVTDQWGNKKLYPFFPGTQEKVALLSSNANEYAGVRDPDWTGTDWEYYDSSNTKHLSIVKMVPALQANKLPLNQYNWVKIGHTADGWYSDWIVTLAEAKHYNVTEPTKWFLRVMAEDLSASEESDFDFNDVVIDVEYTEGETTANITLQAAGGTLPLRIAGNNELEVHKLFGNYPTNVMINTGWSGSNGATADPVEFTLPFSATTEAEFLTGVNNIKLEVEKTTNGEKQWMEMTAHEGEPASKFGVPTKVEWCAERESIKGKYKLFAQWATSGDAYNFKWW